MSPAVRRRLPDERHSITHHFSIGGQEGYVTVGLYEDGTPGEMFIRMAKEGSTVSGLMDSARLALRNSPSSGRRSAGRATRIRWSVDHSATNTRITSSIVARFGVR
jgi:hypothetical protein